MIPEIILLGRFEPGDSGCALADCVGMPFPGVGSLLCHLHSQYLCMCGLALTSFLSHPFAGYLFEAIQFSLRFIQLCYFFLHL